MQKPRPIPFFLGGEVLFRNRNGLYRSNVDLRRIGAINRWHCGNSRSPYWNSLAADSRQGKAGLVGGVNAPVTAFVANAYGAAAPPFPLQRVAYTIPPGTSGSAVNPKECPRVPRLLVCIAHGCITTFCLAGATSLSLTYSRDLLNCGFASSICLPRAGLTYATCFAP